MNFGEILTAAAPFVGVLLGGSGIGFLIARKAYLKLKNNEADNVAIEGLKQSNADLRADNQRLREQLDKERARNADAEARKDAKIEALYDEKNAEKEARVTAETGFCCHYGCACRKPAIGQGREWLAAHKDNPSLGVDFTPIDDLIQSIKRQKHDNS